ncbi:hypothetical protein AGMMS49965_10880 [Bacteroidia bacterium]|nr:hypothetical protein AGMMS49965_10880 [Bacteroidia bacterium]
MVSDVSTPTTNEEAVGGEVYSIAFDSGGCIFSKYRIIYDSMRTVIGNVAVSLNVLPCRKLSGHKVKELLDKMLSKYCAEYAPTNYLANVQENWSPFEVEGVLAEYDAQTTTVGFQSFTRGVSEAAFIYCNDIERYLDDPFWKAYKKYRQVFFVSSNLKGSPQNPLTALLHNPLEDLTGTIDLDNPEYMLVSGIPTNSNITADVRVNGVIQIPGNTVGKKGRFEITYKKRNCQDCTIAHHWDEPNLRNYVTFDDRSKRIFIRPIDPSRLIPLVRPITNVPPVEPVPVASGISPTSPTSPVADTPPPAESAPVAGSEPVVEPAPVVEAAPNQPPPIPHQEKVILLGDDVSGDWKLEAKVTGYRLEPVEIFLETDSFARTNGKKEEPPPPPPPPVIRNYYIDAGDYGRIMDGVTEVSALEEEEPLEPEEPEPHKRYNFIQWNLVKDEKTINGKLYDGYWEAEYLKKPRTLFKAAVISLCAVAILLGVSSGLPMLKEALKPEDPYKYVDVVSILRYARETELNLDKLTQYREACELKEPESQGFIKDFLREWAAGEDRKVQNNSRKIIIQKVENAIAIRNAIIEGDIKSLREYNEVYSVKQSKFRAALDSIGDDASMAVIGNALRKLPNIGILDLDDVAVQILELKGSIQQ